MRRFLLDLYGAAFRLARPNSGLNRAAFNPLVEFLCAGLPASVSARAPGGFRVEVDPNDYNGRKLWLLGANDWKINRTVNALLDPGDVLLDIGSNLGTVGMDALSRVGSRGHVHFFEPQPALAAALLTALRDTCNTTVHAIALYDRDGEMTLRTAAGHTGQAHLSGGDGGAGLVVPLRETHAYVRSLIEGQRFGIKIDVEGAEPTILPRLLGIEGLKFVVFEGGADHHALMDLFVEAGFSVFGLRRTLFAPSVVRIADAEASRSFHDFIAARVAPAPPERPISLRQLRTLIC